MVRGGGRPRRWSWLKEPAKVPPPTKPLASVCIFTAFNTLSHPEGITFSDGGRGGAGVRTGDTVSCVTEEKAEAQEVKRLLHVGVQPGPDSRGQALSQSYQISLVVAADHTPHRAQAGPRVNRALPYGNREFAAATSLCRLRTPETQKSP